MTHLTTNPNKSGESEQPGEDDDAYMEIDLEGKADSWINAKVIDWASRLVYNEQTVCTCILCKGLELIHDHQDIDSHTLEDADVIFTLADVCAFATEKFHLMRCTNLQQTQSGPRHNLPFSLWSSISWAKDATVPQTSPSVARIAWTVS